MDHMTTVLPEHMTNSGPTMESLERAEVGKVLVFFYNSQFEVVLKHDNGYFYFTQPAIEGLFNIYAHSIIKFSNVLMSGQDLSTSLGEPMKPGALN